MSNGEKLELVSDLMETLRQAQKLGAEFDGPVLKTVFLPGNSELTEGSSWTEIVEALRLWQEGKWQASNQELKTLTTFARNNVSESSTLGQFMHGQIDEDELVSQVSMPVSPSLEQRRKTIFEVILRQAKSGEEWKESLAGLMLANEIQVEEVEAELTRRKGSN